MRAPDPLWSGDRDQGLRGPADEPTSPLPRADETPPRRPSAPGAAPRPPRGSEDAGRSTPARRRIPVLVAVLAGMLIAVGAFALGALLDGDDAGTTTVAAPLPAARGGSDATRAGEVYRSAGRSVVQVRRQGGSGTGFVVQGQGTVVTNAHVVGNARSVQLVLDDGSDPIAARVLGTDASTDLAVVKTNDADALDGRPALPLADSDDVQVGGLAVAIGYPLGLDRTVTQGIVSGIGRQIEAPNGFSIDKVIQTDAPINPGNSGGPLLDSRGRVVGVNSQIATAGSGSGGNVGIGFAVPANTVREVVPVLERGGTVERPYLGVSTSETSNGAPGAQVVEVRPGGPASAAGLRAGSLIGSAGGDVITAIDGQQVAGPDDVAKAVNAHEPGDRVELRVKRGETTTTLTATLQERPQSAGP